MDGIAWAASAMIAARKRLEIATENLANLSTERFSPIEARGFLEARGVRIGESRGSAKLPAGANVDAISQMVAVLAAERSFESAQKTVSTIDGVRQKSADAARIK